MLLFDSCWRSKGVHELVYGCSLAGRFELHLYYTDPAGAHRALQAASPSPLEVLPNRADARGSVLRPSGRFGQLVVSAGRSSARGRSSVPTSASNAVVTAGTDLNVSITVADRYGNPTMPATEGSFRSPSTGPTASATSRAASRCYRQRTGCMSCSTSCRSGGSTY